MLSPDFKLTLVRLCRASCEAALRCSVGVPLVALASVGAYVQHRVRALKTILARPRRLLRRRQP